jgi:hypothetical protein
MSLLAQQIVIGRCLRAAGADPLSDLADMPHGVTLDRDEATELAELVQSSGFGFTRRVQRSWCLGRSEAAAELTLSALPTEERRWLVEEWVAAGGGTAFDPVSEADQFLEFVASRLTDPSHELTICRMEQAVHRASEAALSFTPPDPSLLDDPTARVVNGKGAVLVRFLAEPQQLFEAIRTKERLPPLSNRCVPVLFAPGFATLFRVASAEEAAIWGELSRPITMGLCRGRYARETVEELFLVGALELVQGGRPRR